MAAIVSKLVVTTMSGLRTPTLVVINGDKTSAFVSINNN
jgi:hypothetical protein